MDYVKLAWLQHQGELRNWLRTRLERETDVEDMLQDVFFKALMQNERFSTIENVRAWLFHVARNAVIDRYRLHKDNVSLPDDLAQDIELSFAVDELSQCLPRVLLELSEADREVITLCDLDGMPQQHFADLKGISLPATKSRIQRARLRLRQTLETNCKVQRDNADKICCFVPREPLK